MSSTDVPEYRIALDLRSLNANTIETDYYIPKITDVLGKLKGKSSLSSFDIRNGYNNIELHDSSKRLCGFKLKGKYYRMLRSCYGFRNMPFMFQKLVKNMLLEGKIDGFNYIDDINICVDDHEKNYHNILRLIDVMYEYGLKFRPDKIKVFTKELKSLGRVVNSMGIRLKMNDILKVLNLTSCKTKKELMSLQGLVNWLSNFINLDTFKEYFSIKQFKNKAFSWSKEMDHMLTKMKYIIWLQRRNIIYHYVHGSRIIIECDSSKKGYGCVIYQLIKQNGKPVNSTPNRLSGKIELVKMDEHVKMNELSTPPEVE